MSAYSTIEDEVVSTQESDVRVPFSTFGLEDYAPQYIDVIEVIPPIEVVTVDVEKIDEITPVILPEEVVIPNFEPSNNEVNTVIKDNSILRNEELVVRQEVMAEPIVDKDSDTLRLSDREEVVEESVTISEPQFTVNETSEHLQELPSNNEDQLQVEVMADIPERDVSEDLRSDVIQMIVENQPISLENTAPSSPKSVIRESEMTSDVGEVSMIQNGGEKNIPVLEPSQQNHQEVSDSLELRVTSPEILVFENMVLRDEAKPLSNSQNNEAKPLQERVANVLTILNPESEEVVTLVSVPMVTEHDEGIAIITVEGKKILGVSVIKAQETNETPEEQELAPVAALPTLEKTLDTAIRLVSARITEDENQIKHQTEREEPKPEIVIVVSETILKLIESMREEDDLLEKQMGSKDGEENERIVTFVVDGEQPHTLEIKEKELLQLQLLLGSDRMNSEPEILSEKDEIKELGFNPTHISTIIGLSEALKTLHLEERKIIDSDSEEGSLLIERNKELQTQQTPEKILLVSEEIMSFIENLRQKLPKRIEEPLKKKMTTELPGEEKKEEIPGTRNIIFQTLGREGKQILLNENELLQLQQFFIEHDSLRNIFLQDENLAVVPLPDQLKTELNMVITEIQMRVVEDIHEATMEVSEKLLDIVEEKRKNLDDLEPIDTSPRGKVLNRKERETKPKQYITLFSGERKIKIDTDTLRKIQLVLNEEKKTVTEKSIFVEDEQAPEEIKTQITPYLAGADMVLLRVYQALLFLLNENNKVHYSVVEFSTNFVQPDHRQFLLSY